MQARAQPRSRVAALYIEPPTDRPTPTAPDDEIALARQAQINPQAFAPLYERYFERVLRYCLRRTDSLQEAEDLCSQIFARALAGLSTYRGGQFGAWLFRIAHHTLANYYRDSQRQIDGLALDDLDAADDAAARAFDRADDDDRRMIRRLVAALPDDQRELLTLTFDGGLTSAEVGAIVGKSAGAVRVQLHRIIKSLRAQHVRLTGGQA
jgi:RNA polymerase sigma-70 factor (ECF subfamily)